MANYESLKSSIQQVVRANGNQEITGDILQQVLLAMVNSLGDGYQFAGIATPSTNPGVPDQRVFYIAVEPGIYRNFGTGIPVVSSVVVIRYDSVWSAIDTGIPNNKGVQDVTPLIVHATDEEDIIETDLDVDAIETAVESGKRVVLRYRAQEMGFVSIGRHGPTTKVAIFANMYDATGENPYLQTFIVQDYECTVYTDSLTKNSLIGVLSHLQTEYKANLVGAINEVTQNITELGDAIAVEETRAKEAEENIIGKVTDLEEKIGVESLDKDFTEQDYSNLLWGGVSDGWLDASGQNYNSFIFPLLPSCTLHISDIVGTINYKYVFDYVPIVGKKDDRIDTFPIDTYTNNTDKLVYVYIGWMNGQHSLRANIDGSGILKRLQDLEKSSGELSGKTIVCFGDSLTEFVERDGKKYSYPDYIRDITNANVINLGIGGTRLRQRAEPIATPTSINEGYASLDIVNLVNACCTGDFTKQVAGANYLKQYAQDDNTAIVTRASAVDWSKVDIVTILAGTNDWTSAPYPQGYGESGSKDKNLTLGAVNVIVETLLTAYPHLKIYYFSPVIRYVNLPGKVGWSDDVVFFNKTLRDFSEMLLKEFKLNHVPSCNLYDEIGWNRYNFENYFIRSVDDTHPYKGFYNIARKVIAFLVSNRNF